MIRDARARENDLPVITALGDRVGNSGNNDSGTARHAQDIVPSARKNLRNIRPSLLAPSDLMSAWHQRCSAAAIYDVLKPSAVGSGAGDVG
ncbi:MAG TPA: hypothetical protein VNH18_11425 [Bryobacteraceae bacterium]|nr:hypothetical protein [Bryobacteraceae bacterium]